MKKLFTVLILISSFPVFATEWTPYWDDFGGNVLNVKNVMNTRHSGKSLKKINSVHVEIEGCVATLGLSDFAFILGLKSFKANLKSCDESELIIAPTYYRTTAADNCMNLTQNVVVNLPKGCEFNANSGKIIIDHNFEK